MLQLFDAIDEGGRNAFDYLQNYSINKANNRAHNFRLRENIEMSQALAWGDDLIFMPMLHTQTITKTRRE